MRASEIVVIEQLFYSEMADIIEASIKERFHWKAGFLPARTGYYVWGFNTSRLQSVFNAYVVIVAASWGGQRFADPERLLAQAARDALASPDVQELVGEGNA